jgi:beta-lactamase class A
MIDRRAFTGGLALAAGGALGAAPASDAPIAALERERGGRLGVFAFDTGKGRTLAHRADERFLMCSTFKTVLAAAVLQKVDRGEERLDRPIPYSKADLLSWAPVTEANVAKGALSVGELCAAAVQVSDNPAANLLFPLVGGPAGLTRFLRGIGDKVTRCDRLELMLNSPDGQKDTTTPRAMALTVRTLLLRDVLSPVSRARLEGWMITGDRGLKRLRAGLAPGWAAGDKTGTGKAQTNDVAIFRRPGRGPILVSAYYQAPDGGAPEREAVLAEVGKIVMAWAG